jgi:cell division septum initiation protein DivIVA
MRAFVSLRRLLATNEDLSHKFAELERKLEGHDDAIKSLFDAIRELMQPPKKQNAKSAFTPSPRNVNASKSLMPNTRHR